MKEIPNVAAHENSSSISSLKKDIVLKFLISFFSQSAEMRDHTDPMFTPFE